MKLTGRKVFALLGLAIMTFMVPLAAQADPPLDVNKSTCGEFVDYFDAAQAEDKAKGNEHNPMTSKLIELLMWTAENTAKINGGSPDNLEIGAGVYIMCLQNRDAAMTKAIKMLK
jgi:hypothetical protein